MRRCTPEPKRRITEGRVRTFLGSEEVQTAQLHPIKGTPVEVPHPRIVISKLLCGKVVWDKVVSGTILSPLTSY